uniref:Uncharacterized protein n=1 Tax=Oryza barthii TaxID=65489 RepID=A0A0D3HN48_9ORYZ
MATREAKDGCGRCRSPGLAMGDGRRIYGTAASTVIPAEERMTTPSPRACQRGLMAAATGDEEDVEETQGYGSEGWRREKPKMAMGVVAPLV